MSLVDYASSSDENDAEVKGEVVEREEGEGEGEGVVEVEGPEERKEEESLPSAVNSHNQRSISSSHQQPASASSLPAPSIENLPDASLLLSSQTLSSHQMSGTDHYSRVAAAMAESASRKREINGSASFPRSKFPRRSSPNLSNGSNSESSLLLPPQMRGRSNVVTEDISKLFVKRH